MSFNAVKVDFTIEASADLSAQQFRAVKIGTNGAVVAGVNESNIAGILQNNPNAAGQAAIVQYKGAARAKVGAAVARGALLATDANGDLITTATQADVVAVALEAGSGAGSIVAVLLK